MPWHSGNFFASIFSPRHKDHFQPPPDPAVKELSKQIDLWEFLSMDSRPTIILDKTTAESKKYDATLSPIVYRNVAFDKIAGSLDVDAFLLKLSKTAPGMPLYMAGRIWGNYSVGPPENRNWVVITGDSTRYTENYSWMPAEGWISSALVYQNPGPEQQYQYYRRETAASGKRIKDRVVPSNPLLDWTRPSSDRWLPEHYRTFHQINWKETSLGNLTRWSSSLRMVTNAVMMSPFQMILYWGPRYIMLYNEQYADVCRRRHPDILGQALERVWPEAFNKLHDYLRQARSGKPIIRIEDTIPTDRHDRTEECYFDYTITPIIERAGKIGGLLCQQYESTARVLMNRRMQTLKTLRSVTAQARNAENFWNAVLETFDGNVLDTPFVMLYVIDPNNQNEARLVGIRPDTDNHRLAPPLLVLAEGEYIFSRELRTARQLGRKQLRKDIEKHRAVADFHTRGFPDPCGSAVVIPIIRGETIQKVWSPDYSHTEAFLILGLNPRRPFDNDYETWIDQIQTYVSRYFAEVKMLEREWQQLITAKLEEQNTRRASELQVKLMELESNLRQTELKFMKMAECVPVGIVEMDLEGEEVYNNAAFSEIMMLPPGSSAWQEVIYPDDLPRALQCVSRAVETGELFRTEVRIRDPKIGDSSLKWIAAEIVPMYGDNGMLMGFYKTIVDVTSIKAGAEIAKQRADEAVQRNSQTDRFIDMTCHELRNPLGAILQSAEMINDTVDVEDADAADVDLEIIRESCQTILLCVSHQRRIIDDILVTSKLDADLLPVNPVEINPAKLIGKWITIFEGDMAAREIKLSCVIDESYNKLCVDWVKADPGRLMQILVNLLTNATKFTTGQDVRTIEVHVAASIEEPQSFGSVSYAQSDDDGHHEFIDGPDWGDGDIVHIIFSVRDSGIGISDADQKTLFQRFYQVPKTSLKYGGSGLGLYICRSLAKLQGGSIGVNSVKGKGSEFSFFIKTRRTAAPENTSSMNQFLGNQGARMNPRRRSVDAQKESEPAKPAKAIKSSSRRLTSLSGCRILIVEDNLVNRKVLDQQLRISQCITYCATNGQHACDIITKSKLSVDCHDSDAPDLDICLMDVEMPVMNGIDATKKIRQMQADGKLHRHLIILGVSANVRSNQINEMMDAGMDDVLSKPFRIQELADKVVALARENGTLTTWTMDKNEMASSGGGSDSYDPEPPPDIRAASQSRSRSRGSRDKDRAFSDIAE